MERVYQLSPADAPPWVDVLIPRPRTTVKVRALRYTHPTSTSSPRLDRSRVCACPLAICSQLPITADDPSTNLSSGPG